MASDYVCHRRVHVFTHVPPNSAGQRGRLWPPLATSTCHRAVRRTRAPPGDWGAALPSLRSAGHSAARTRAGQAGLRPVGERRRKDGHLTAEGDEKGRDRRLRPLWVAIAPPLPQPREHRAHGLLSKGFTRGLPATAPESQLEPRDVHALSVRLCKSSWAAQHPRLITTEAPSAAW